MSEDSPKVNHPRLPLTVEHPRSGEKLIIGQAAAWVENDQIMIEGTIDDPDDAILIQTRGFGQGILFSTPNDFTASIPLKGEFRVPMDSSTETPRKRGRRTKGRHAYRASDAKARKAD